MGSCDLLRVSLRKPKGWRWELTTSASSPAIVIPKIELVDHRGRLLCSHDPQTSRVSKSKSASSISARSSRKSTKSVSPVREIAVVTSPSGGVSALSRTKSALSVPERLVRSSGTLIVTSSRLSPRPSPSPSPSFTRNLNGTHLGPNLPLTSKYSRTLPVRRTLSPAQMSSCRDSPCQSTSAVSEFDSSLPTRAQDSTRTSQMPLPIHTRSLSADHTTSSLSRKCSSPGSITLVSKRDLTPSIIRQDSSLSRMPTISRSSTTTSFASESLPRIRKKRRKKKSPFREDQEKGMTMPDIC